MSMSVRALSLIAGAFALLVTSGIGHAQDQKYPSAEEMADMQGKVRLASGLIALGRSEQDPTMLLVAAKILSGVDAEVRDPGPNASARFDVAAILGEARTLAGDDQSLLDQIAAVPVQRGERGRYRYCGWAYQCGTFECDWVYSCNW